MSDCATEKMRFDTPAELALEAAFDGGRITSDGGLAFLEQAEAEIGACQAIATEVPEWRRDAVRHPLSRLVKQRVFQIACGYEDQDDADFLRSDPLLKLVCGALPDSDRDLASQPTICRMENAVDSGACYRMARALGRPRLKGERLANLSAVTENPDTEWEPITITGWYGGGQRSVEMVSATAVWYHSGLPVAPLRWVLIRDPQAEFETQALLCTDLDADPECIISWFVRRWQMETTFAESRQRLGVETQRHYSQKAMERTAPAMLGLFSVVTLLADRYMAEDSGLVRARTAAWYDKRDPTFSDALAVVRKELWAAQRQRSFCGSRSEGETVEIPREFMERLTDAVCYTA